MFIANIPWTAYAGSGVVSQSASRCMWLEFLHKVWVGDKINTTTWVVSKASGTSSKDRTTASADHVYIGFQMRRLADDMVVARAVCEVSRLPARDRLQRSRRSAL